MDRIVHPGCRKKRHNENKEKKRRREREQRLIKTRKILISKNPFKIQRWYNYT
jgi:hypothetical protein